MTLNPYLSFPGQCEEAFNFYAQVLGGKIVCSFPYSEAPVDMPTSPEWQKKIMHARFEVDGQVIMGCDASPERYHKPQGISVTLNLDDPSKAERIYKDLSEGGAIHMPMEETFWAHRFAMFVDRFGTPWMINCEKTP